MSEVMKLYRAEKNADLEFAFPEALDFFELDRQSIKLPVNMKFVDLVIERDRDILIIEIKDPSNSDALAKDRTKYLKRLKDNSVLSQELTPKARDSYLFLHLMERDHKPIKYFVLLGLEAFDAFEQRALLAGFKDRLLADIRCEADTPWRRQHIADCAVLSVDIWNRSFPDWPVVRLSAEAANEGAAA